MIEWLREEELDDGFTDEGRHSFAGMRSSCQVECSFIEYLRVSN